MESQLENHLKTAEQLKKIGEIEKAIAQYSLALELNPNCIPALITLADIYEEKNQLNEAINYRERAVKLMPNNSNAPARLGKLLLAVGKTEKAIEYYQQAINLNPKQPAGVYHELGDAFNGSKKLESAITAYQTALESNPVNPDIILNKLGDVCLKAKRFERAVTAYEELIKIKPQQGAGVFINLGEALKQLDKKEEAGVAYQKAVEREPENIIARGKLAHWFLIADNVSRAIEEYEQALNLKGNKPAWIYHQLGDAYLKNGQSDEAEKICQTGIKINPNNQALYHKLAQCYHKQNRLKEAEEQCLKALEINPDFVPALNFLATIKEEQEEYDLALSYLQQGLKIEPENDNLQARIGRIKWWMGDGKAAINEYQKAIKMTQAPAYWVYTHLGSLLMEQGKKDQAVAIYKEVLHLYPEKAEAFRSILAQIDGVEIIKNYQENIKLQPEQPFWVYSNLGELLILENRLDEAMATYLQAIQVYPDNPIFYCKLGAVQLKQGNKTEACNSYYKAIELEPEQSLLEVYATLGKLLQELGRLNEAVIIYEKAALFHPEAENIARHLSLSLQQFDPSLKQYQKTIAPPKEAIIIVGMHRSGTSALTRILSLLGFSLPQKLMIGGSDNIKGNWEPARVMKIHDEAFASIGSSWNDYFSFPQAWFDSVTANNLSEKIIDFLAKEFGETNSFIIKDPRISILLPLWYQPLAIFNTDVSYILPIRNPLEVAESLWQRNKISISEGLLLWLKYVLDGERHTRGKKRVFTYYQELLEQPLLLLERVKNELDLSREIQDNIHIEIDDFLDKRLRHHQFDFDIDKGFKPLVSHLSNWVKEAYNALLNIRENESVSLEILDNIRNQLESAELLYGSIRKFAINKK